VSIWEIAIKSKLDKIEVESEDLVQEITANNFVELPISAQHAKLAGSLPRHHDDPFDRMLIAQAQLEGLIVVTHDRAFQAYDVSILAT
jgi:PIN domain nuclease of toxin-antitoxin system